jgi:hypothetical protein
MRLLYWRLSGDAKSIKNRDGVVDHMLVNATGLYLLAKDGGVIIQVSLPYAALQQRVRTAALVRHAGALRAQWLHMPTPVRGVAGRRVRAVRRVHHRAFLQQRR